MNQIVPSQQPRNEQKKLMLLDYMADKYSLTAEQFRSTVRATCGLATATPEQVAAFLIVAKEYDLNPLLKEIYAFPAKGGGVVPIVSIDGWVNLVNSHPQCDGFNFSVENDEEGKLYSMTCTMHRKDRKHPTVVTEYLSECIRSTEPWKMKHRMLRHKSFIQAARYAFGFAGIYDEDEGRVIAEAQSVQSAERPRVPSPNEVEQIEHQPAGRDDHPDHGSDKYRPGDVVDGKPATDTLSDEEKRNRAAALAQARANDPITSGPQPNVGKSAPPVAAKKSTLPDIEKDYEGFVSLAIMRIGDFDDGGALESFWNDEVAPFETGVMPPDWDDLLDAYNKQQTKLQAED